jgi:hypothetical protein
MACRFVGVGSTRYIAGTSGIGALDDDRCLPHFSDCPWPKDREDQHVHGNAHRAEVRNLQNRTDHISTKVLKASLSAIQYLPRIL